jgi:hypothetical protein
LHIEWCNVRLESGYINTYQSRKNFLLSVGRATYRSIVPETNPPGQVVFRRRYRDDPVADTVERGEHSRLEGLARSATEAKSETSEAAE